VAPDEIERLRSVLARAYEQRPSLRIRVIQAVRDRLGARIKKKAIAERVDIEKPKDAV